MNDNDIAAKAHAVQKILVEAPDKASPALLWKQILALCGQTENAGLSKIDFESCLGFACSQVETIVAGEPLPDDLTFIYFGLYDSLEDIASPEAVQVGVYFAGGTDHDPEEAIENGSLSYFPLKRRIQADMLTRIREEGRNKPNEHEIFEWLLVLAGAALLARSAAARLCVQVPTFVGFDSGDYFQVRL